MGARLLLGAMLAAVAISGCRGSADTASKPPSPADILNKPGQANVKDAHFTLTTHIASSNSSFDGTGDGLMIFQPKRALRSRIQANDNGQTIKFEHITVDGNDYSLNPDSPRWIVTPAASSGGFGSFKGTSATLVGEETLKMGRAWHVKATAEDGNPFELWVRESDGYPLEYMTSSQASSITLLFDQFNTGQTITAPPASDVQSG